MKYKIGLLAVILIVFSGKASGQYCTNDFRYTEAPFFNSTQITVGANIQYGIATDFQGNPDTLLLDLYYPNLGIDLSPKRPFILLAHGGGFSSGNKQAGDIRDLSIQLAMRGFVTASINYRLGYDFTEYGQYKARYRAIQDGNAALRFIVNNANTVRIDTNWLFVGGQSAGALLAMGMVYADQFELDSISLLYNAIATSAELGNLHTSGNTLTNTYSIKGIFNNWGAAVESEIDPDELLPTIAFHGERDSTVLIDADFSFDHYTLNGSRALHTTLISNNICSELTVDTLGGHGIYRNASSVFRAQRASCFFKQIFCADCTDVYTTDSLPANCASTLSAEDYNDASNVKIYPNPVGQAIYIDGLPGMLDLKIFNLYGQLVYEGKTTDGAAQIDLSPGMYVLVVKHQNSNQSFTTKLVKN